MVLLISDVIESSRRHPWHVISKPLYKGKPIFHPVHQPFICRPEFARSQFRQRQVGRIIHSCQAEISHDFPRPLSLPSYRDLLNRQISQLCPSNLSLLSVNSWRSMTFCRRRLSVSTAKKAGASSCVPWVVHSCNKAPALSLSGSGTMTFTTRLVSTQTSFSGLIGSLAPREAGGECLLNHWSWGVVLEPDEPHATILARVWKASISCS
jgi:hypothetical protein